VRGLKSNSSPGARVRALGLCLLLLVGGPALAQWSTTQGVAYSQTAARAVTALPQSQLTPGALLTGLLEGRTYTPKSGSLGDVDVRDVTKGISPAGGPPINVTMKRALQWSAIARGAAKALPLISTAIAIKELMDEVRCQEGFGGGGECDDGQPEAPTAVRCVNNALSVAGISLNNSGGVPVTCAPTTQQIAATFQDRLYSTGRGCYGGACYRFEALDQGSVRLLTCFSGGVACTNPSVNTIPASSGVQTACPAVTVNGVQLVPVKGPDGFCPTGIFEPKNEDQIAGKLENYGSKSRAPTLAPILDIAGIPVTHPSPTFEPPAVVQGGRETTQFPDGRTVTRDTDYPMEPTPEGYKWRDRVVEREWSPGTVPTAPGETPSGTEPPGTTTTGEGDGPAPAPVEFKTCGLPGTPPCKIDEGGTPPPNVSDWINPEVAGAPLRALVDNPDVADTAWSFTFTLPAECSVLVVGTFAGQEVSVDLCRYQPMIHELVSLLWIGATFWFAVGLVFRAFG